MSGPAHRRDSGASVVDSISHSGDSSLRGPKRPMEDLSSTHAYARNLHTDLEQSNLDRIKKDLKGKLHLQSLVLLQLEKGTLESKLGGQGEKRDTAAPSCDQFQLLSGENNNEILTHVDPEVFKKTDLDMLKGQLAEIVYTGMIELGSAIPARKMSAIAGFVKTRASDVARMRHKDIDYTKDSHGKINGVDWAKCGVFEIIEVTNEEGTAVIGKSFRHKLAAQTVQLTAEFARTNFMINFLESLATIELEYTSPKAK